MPASDASTDLPTPKEIAMRTTVALDDALLADAIEYTGIKEKSALLREALIALIQREAARRLARIGGTAPGFTPGPRKRYAAPK